MWVEFNLKKYIYHELKEINCNLDILWTIIYDIKNWVKKRVFDIYSSFSSYFQKYLLTYTHESILKPIWFNEFGSRLRSVRIRIAQFTSINNLKIFKFSESFGFSLRSDLTYGKTSSVLYIITLSEEPYSKWLQQAMISADADWLAWVQSKKNDKKKLCYCCYQNKKDLFNIERFDLVMHRFVG